MDVIGLRTAYNIAAASPDEKMRAAAALLKERYIDQGKLGRESGEGFYTTPTPPPYPPAERRLRAFSRRRGEPAPHELGLAVAVGRLRHLGHRKSRSVRDDKSPRRARRCPLKSDSRKRGPPCSEI